MSKTSYKITKPSKTLLFATILAALSFLVFPVGAMAGVEGLWLSKKKDTVILIERCDTGICGYIHWIHPEVMQKDSRNPNPEKRDRPLCGVKVLWGFEKPDNEGEAWKNGHIYKADDGEFYRARVEVEKDGRLALRGYIGVPFLGKTARFTPTDNETYPSCKRSLSKL